MTSRLSRLVLVLLALALVFPASAMAAEVLEYQLQYSPVSELGGALAIVNATINPQEPLPATVEVPVPAGAVVLWAGEIMRTDASADVQRETTVERVGEMDVYTLTLEKSYTAQLEIRLPDPTIEGSRVRATVSWTNPGDEVLMSGGVVVEAGAGDVTTSPEIAGEVRERGNESLYPLKAARLASGQTYTIEVEWTRGAGQAGEGGDSVSIPPLLLIALVASIVTLLAVIASQRLRARKHTPESE